MVRLIYGEHRVRSKEGGRIGCAGGLGFVGPKKTLEADGTGIHGEVRMIFEHLHHLFHARDHPGLAICSREGERDGDNGAYGAHEGEHRKGVRQQVSVCATQQVEHGVL